MDYQTSIRVSRVALDHAESIWVEVFYDLFEALDSLLLYVYSQLLIPRQSMHLVLGVCYWVYKSESSNK